VAGFLFFFSLLVLFEGIPHALTGRVDFSQLFTAGYMTRSGNASSLYDFAAQQRVYRSLIPQKTVWLPFDHPAYEALIFAPLSLLKYRDAYIVFLAINLALLSTSILILWPRFSHLADIWKPLPAALIVCFMPVTIALLQGQDSLLLLGLVAGAAVSLDRGHEAAAGAFAGAALFKFQFVIPIALLFLLWRRWRFVAGFSAAGFVAVALSVLVVGWRGLIAFAYRLGSISVGLHSADQSTFGVRPAAMANLRGLCYVLFSSSPRVGQIVTVLLSAALFIYVVRKKPSIDLAILFAALVSYHGLSHDMSLLVIPAGMTLLTGYAVGDGSKVFVAAVLLIAPTFLFLLTVVMNAESFFLLSIPTTAVMLLASEAPPIPQAHSVV
jgi:hypothetical protein